VICRRRPACLFSSYDPSDAGIFNFILKTLHLPVAVGAVDGDDRAVLVPRPPG
jgi:hypothetical protein